MKVRAIIKPKFKDLVETYNSGKDIFRKFDEIFEVDSDRAKDLLNKKLVVLEETFELPKQVKKSKKINKVEK